MKIIKESLNEIKQNNKISGLGSIGIGTTAINKAYKHIIKTWPETYDDSYDLLSNAKYYQNSYALKYPKILEDVEQLLNTSQNDILYAVMIKRSTDPNDILNCSFKLLEKSADLTKYIIKLSPWSYCIMKLSQHLGMMSASIYDRVIHHAKATQSERKFTLFFIRKD